MERSITNSLDCRPDLLYEMNDLAVGQMRGTSRCSMKPLHAHEGYMLEFVDTGSMWLLEPKARRSLVGQGQYYILRPDQEHSQEVDPQVHTLFVDLPKHQVEEIAQEVSCRKKPTNLEPAFAFAQPDILATLGAIATEVAHPLGGIQFMLQSLSIQLTVQLLRTQHDGQEEKRACQVSGVLSPEIRRSVEFIHAFYTENLSLHQVAASASLSQYHFLRLFKRQIGMTPHAYIQHLRLQHAALLLSRSNETISEIASHLGFSSPGHFTDSFRRQYGLTPSQYRAR